MHYYTSTVYIYICIYIHVYLFLLLRAFVCFFKTTLVTHMVIICLPGQRWQMLLSCFDSANRGVVALLDNHMTHTLTESQLCRPAPSAASTASACHPGCVAVPLVIRCDRWVCSYVFFHCCHLLMTCVWSVESECWHTRHRTGHHLHICMMILPQCLSIYVFIATIHSIFYSFLFSLFFSFV